MNTKTASLGDRYGELATLILTLIALLLGWALMYATETRSVSFTAGEISGQAPQGWMLASEDGDTLFRASDRSASGFATSYSIQSMPVKDGAAPADVVSLLTLARGRELTAFRLLSQEDVQVNGRDAVKLTYVFVESNPDVTHADLPSVVKAEEYIFISGARALLVSFRAEESAFAGDAARFLAFLQSLDF